MAEAEKDSGAGIPADDEREGDVEEDPFLLSTEWASEADERAYAEF